MLETLQDFAVATQNPASSDHQSGLANHAGLGTTTHPGTFRIIKISYHNLFGGFRPCETYYSQNASFPQKEWWKQKIFETTTY